jgi:pimeloyl-ACP methyl ester carboxylesterase
MSGTMHGLFVPGWGATAGLYVAGLPEGWEALELPSFRTTRGELSAYRRWLGAEITRGRTPVALAGHSMGGALALLAAVDQPELLEKLILLSPAGLPVSKPLRASMATFAGQVARGCYPTGELCRALARTATAPRAALRVARSVHDLDLTPELERIRTHRVPCTVVGCASDELTTPAHCRRLATLLNATYREVDASEGHIWMITEPHRLANELTR